MKMPRLVGGLLVVFILRAQESCAQTTCTLPSVSEATRVLLDSYNFTDLESEWILGDGWMIESSTPCFQSVLACNSSGSDLLVTPFIAVPQGVQEINIFVEYVCPSSQSTCNTDFSLFINETSAPSSSGAVMISNYMEITGPVPNNTRIAHHCNQSEGFYLAFQGTSSCVEITRVRVVYVECAATQSNFADYPVTFSGGCSEGECVPNAVVNNTPLRAQCDFEQEMLVISGSCHCAAGSEPIGSNCSPCAPNSFKPMAGNTACMSCPTNAESPRGSLECQCITGFRISTQTDRSLECSECIPDYYLDSGTCRRCPYGSSSVGGDVRECQCNEGLVTSNDSSSTDGDNCSNCQMNYFRKDGICMPCPDMSGRDFNEVESQCVCVESRVTDVDSNTTTGGNCSRCAPPLYFNNGSMSAVECVQCPSNSMSSGSTATACTCNSGTSLNNSADTDTTFEPCSGCAPSYYKPDLSTFCTRCPANSDRMKATDPESICECNNANFRRPSSGPAENCLIIIGFRDQTIVLQEGLTSKNVSLFLSAAAEIDIMIPILSGGDEDGIVITGSLDVPQGVLKEVVPIMNITDDEIALEENITLTITLSGTTFFVVGVLTIQNGMQLYPRTTVTVVDDDFVTVGFTESRATFNETTRTAKVVIKRLASIASDLPLRITISGDVRAIELQSTSVVFGSGGPDTITIPLTILNDGDITFQLEYAGPSRFDNQVRIGDSDQVHSQIKITIPPDTIPTASAFPLEAIIGVCAAAAGLAVLLLIIIILCLCICRLRVNRQGFYPTYEDKTSEPPTMLRYSASLRSISSQTVIPVTEGRSVTKENEFYV